MKSILPLITFTVLALFSCTESPTVKQEAPKDITPTWAKDWIQKSFTELERAGVKDTTVVISDRVAIDEILTYLRETQQFDRAHSFLDSLKVAKGERPFKKVIVRQYTPELSYETIMYFNDSDSLLCRKL